MTANEQYPVVRPVGPKFESGGNEPVKSFCKAAWGGILDGVTKPDSTNKPHGLAAVRFVKLGALQQAVRHLVRRHTVLNCRLEDRDGYGWLIPLDSEPQIEVLDYGHCDTKTDRAVAERALGRLVWAPFDVSQGPLFRVFAVRFGPDEFYIGFVAHHFVADAVSAGVIMSELVQLHDSLARRQVPNLPPVALRYQDYLRGINTWIRTPEGQAAQASVAKGLEENGPLEFGDLVDRDIREAEYFQMDGDVVQMVKKTARAIGTSPFVVLLATQNMLIQPYGRGDRAVVKVITTGRETGDLARIVGNMADRMFVSTPLSDDPTFREVVRRTHAAVSQSRKTAFVRSDFQLEELAKYGMSGAAPVFNFRSVPGPASSARERDPADRPAPLTIPAFETAKKTVPQDVYYLEMFGNDQDMWGVIRYGQGRIRGFLQAFENTLRKGCEQPDTRLTDFEPFLEREDDLVAEMED